MNADELCDTALLVYNMDYILKGDRTTTNYDNNEVKFKHCDLIA